MFCRKSGLCLTQVAIDLTWIAIRTALRDLLSAPDGGRAGEPALERARKRFCRTKARRQRDIENPRAWLGCKPHGRDLHSSAAQIVAKRFPHPRREEPMEVEWGKMRDFGQGMEVEGLVQMLIDVCEQSGRMSTLRGSGDDRLGVGGPTGGGSD